MFKNKSFIPWAVGVVAVIVVAAIVIGVTANPVSATSANVATVTSVTRAESIEASGYIQAQSYASLAWKTSGTVESIPVKVGDQVRAGDVLMKLQTTSASASIISAQADLVTATKELEDLLRSRLSLANAEQNLANARQAVEDAQEDVDKIDNRRASGDLLDQTQDEIDLAKRKVSRAEDAYKLVKNRPDGDALKSQRELDLINARQERDNKIATLNWYAGTPDDIDAAKYRAALAVAQAQQADAQRDVERLKDGPNAQDVAAAQAKVDAAQATVNSLAIIAPFDGEVLAIEQNPGDVVATNTVALSLANRSKLYIDTEVDEADIALVAVGNLAAVTMDALPGTTLKGTVTFINPVGETVAGLIKYTVRVVLEPAEKPLLLGATADVTLQVGEAVASLAVPASAVQSDKDGEYVMLIAAGGNRRVAVKSGASVGELVIVVGDLKVGDQVQSKFESGVQVPIPGGK